MHILPDLEVIRLQDDEPWQAGFVVGRLNCTKR